MAIIPIEPVVRTANSENWLDRGIIVSRNIGNSMIELEEAQEITRAFVTLCGENCARPLMVDLATPKGQSRETRQYFSNDPSHLNTYTAVALLVSNPISKVLANFYLGLNRPNRPTRLFTDSETAMAWLAGFLPAEERNKQTYETNNNLQNPSGAA